MGRHRYWFQMVSCTRGCEFTVTPYCRHIVRVGVRTVYWCFYLEHCVCGIR